MSNKNYLAGRRLEYAVKKEMEEAGYYVIRASGSHGLFDIVAFKHDHPVQFIQCKLVGTEAQAKLLQKKFMAKPPLRPSTHFYQRLWVKVKGNSFSYTSTV